MVFFTNVLAVLKEFIRGKLTIQIRIPLESGITVGKYRHFTDQEALGLDQELMAMLDLAREQAGVPFLITSGLRKATDNSVCGGVHDSAHLRGLAVDLACQDSISREKMLNALHDVGFVRRGIYLAHLHCDRDPSLPQNVLWVGLETR